jgi:BirA family transcriptional regulator, biotin operon repressor / biotin---[acetyl-CoA-carboxylase] ligase
METSQGITNPWEGAPIRVVERTSSTMDDAALLARGGCPTGAVVVAGFQEKGRGRVPGRSWVSPAWESLLATVVVRISELSFPLPQLPLRAGVAVALAVEEAAGCLVEIKWPNDLLVGGKKLAGLLCETRGDAALIGFGVNCAQTRFPPDLSERACSLFQLRGCAVPVFPLLAAILARLKTGLSDPEWRVKLHERLSLRGKLVSVDLLGSGRTVEGILLEVDEEGRLLLQLQDGQRANIGQGEIRSAR